MDPLGENQLRPAASPARAKSPRRAPTAEEAAAAERAARPRLGRPPRAAARKAAEDFAREADETTRRRSRAADAPRLRRGP